MNPPAVMAPLASGLVVQYLAHLPGDPKEEAAYKRLSDAVTELAVSVDHARETLSAFDDRFPSPRELKDALMNTRARFLPPESKPEIAPDPEWSAQIEQKLTGAFTEDLVIVRIQAIKDMLYCTEGPGRDEISDRKYWQNARKFDLDNFPEAVAAVRQGRTPTREELHLPAPTSQRHMPSRPGVRAITQADVDRAREKSQTTAATEPAEQPPEAYDDGYREQEEREGEETEL